MEIKIQFGSRVKAIRRQRGLSQAEIADATQRSIETISSIERGKSLPNFDTLERLSEALNVPVKDLFEFSEDNKSARRDAIFAEMYAELRTFSDDRLLTAVDLIKALSRME